MIDTFGKPRKPRRKRGLKRPATIPRRPAGAMQARPIEHIDRYSAHTGVGLDVATIISAYRLAENGWPANQCDLFDDRHEVDAHMRSAYDGRVEAVARKEWVIQEGGPAPADIEAAKMLTDALIQVPNWVETLEHQLRANWYGYNLTEIDWQRIDGTAVPVWFENVIPQRIVFDATDRPRLITKLGDTEGVALSPGKWWYSCRTGRLAATSGLMRTSTWWSHFKTLSVRDWLQFADRFGVPYVTGAYDDEMTQEERAKLEDAVSYIGADGYAVFSKAAEIVFHQVENGEHADQIMGGLIGLCDQQNSKLIQGATLVNETGGPGSFALGRVHQGQYHDLVKADAGPPVAVVRHPDRRPVPEVQRDQGAAAQAQDVPDAGYQLEGADRQSRRPAPTSSACRSTRPRSAR